MELTGSCCSWAGLAQASSTIAVAVRTTLPILMLSGLGVGGHRTIGSQLLQGATASGAFYGQGVRLKSMFCRSSTGPLLVPWWARLLPFGFRPWAKACSVLSSSRSLQCVFQTC